MIRETCLEARASWLMMTLDLLSRRVSMEAHNVRSVYIFKKSEDYNVISNDFIISILLRALRQVSLINIYT